MWVNRPSRVSSWPCLGGAEGLLGPANHLLESTEQVHHRQHLVLVGVCLSWATSHLLQMLLCSTDNTEYLTTCKIYQSGTSSKWHIVCMALNSSVWIQGVNCMKWFFMRIRQPGVKCWYFPTQRALVISAVQMSVFGIYQKAPLHLPGISAWCPILFLDRFQSDAFESG